MKKLLLLGSALFLFNQVSASDNIRQGEELYEKAQAIHGSHDMQSSKALPLEYFEALDQAASAGSEKAQKDLKNYADYINPPAESMQAKVVWGGTPAANTKIRAIFAKWAPKE